MFARTANAITYVNGLCHSVYLYMYVTGSGEQTASCISSLNTPAHSDHSGVSGLESADRQGI